MFGIDSAELLIIAVVALVVIGPKDLPRVMRTVGHWVGRARGMARHFRSGLDTMVREAELEEMEKQWKANNERIMREHPQVESGADSAADSDWGKPAPETPAGELPLPLPDDSKPKAPPAPPSGAAIPSSAPPIPSADRPA